MKKLFFFISMIILMANYASAQNEMWVYKTDGSIVRYNTAEIDSIKFIPLGEYVVPEIATNEVENITFTSAVCGGDVASDGGIEVTAKGVCWSTSPNPTIEDDKTEDGSGLGSYTSNLTGLSENTTYYVRAYATNAAGTNYGEEKSFTTLAPINGHYYVDLGLPSGLKWATCNVGADSPEAYGDYFAWGETSAKEEYTEENSITYDKQMNDISGNEQYDAATANWGGPWRMPTDEELQELIDNCEWEWTAQNSVNGYKVTSKTNGNSIFLPAAGYRSGSSLDCAGSYGNYWSSSPNESSSISACFLGFDSSGYGMLNDYRHFGTSVRPVIE